MVTFEGSKGGRFYKTPDGRWVPSVTTFLSHFKTGALDKWIERIGETEANKIKNIAARRGTIFHSLCEDYLSTGIQFPFVFENNWHSMMPDAHASFMNAKKYLDKIDNIRHIETPLYSRRFRLAGRTDCIADYDGVLSVIDFKTSLVDKEESWIVNYFEQETLYRNMYFELTGTRIDQIVTIVTSLYDSNAQCFIKDPGDYIEELSFKYKEYEEYFNIK